MKNLFKNAKFGDLYISKDGTKHTFCSFTKSGNDILAKLYREKWGVIIVHLDGRIHSGFVVKDSYTISERLQGTIDEEKLDRHATDALENINPTKALNKIEAFDWGYKAGYRKAKEEQL